MWASTEASPRKPGAQWGLPQQKPVAKARCALDTVLKPIDMSEFELPPGAQFVEVRNELNGPSANFGKLAASLMVKALKQASAWPTVPIERISYEDRYVRSPLVLKLLIDTANELFRASGAKSGELHVMTGASAEGDLRSPPFRIEHDWRDPKTQREVAAAYGALVGLEISLKQSETTHSRRMHILFSNNRQSRIILDQGFGAWGTPYGKSVKHDFLAAPEAQANILRQFRENLHFRSLGATYFVALADK